MRTLKSLLPYSFFLYLACTARPPVKPKAGARLHLRQKQRQQQRPQKFSGRIVPKLLKLLPLMPVR
jgi:hypothetical protein